MVALFREGPGPHALALAMIGVRLGERQLLIGDDAALFAALATKVGVTGHSLAVAGSEPSASRLREAAAAAGVLLDVEFRLLPALPLVPQAFDVAVIDAGPSLLHLDPARRVDLARAVFQSVRPGGRAVVSERPATRLFGLVRTTPPALREFRARGGAEHLLEEGGFRPVRCLAQRDGQRFAEGRRPGIGS
jgi:SAM-dependent methyltransferase